MDGEEYNKNFQYINEGTYSIEGKNTLNIRRGTGIPVLWSPKSIDRRINKFYILMKKCC